MIWYASATAARGPGRAPPTLTAPVPLHWASSLQSVLARTETLPRANPLTAVDSMGSIDAMYTVRSAAIGAAVLSLVLTAQAPVRADEARGREFYQRGLGAFEAGRFAEAARLFEDAYNEVRRPQILWNIGQAYLKEYRVCRDPSVARRAQAVFLNFAELAEDSDERQQAAREAGAIEKMLAESGGRAPLGQAPGSGGAAGSAASTAPPAPSPSATANVAATPDVLPGRKPLHRRPWFWVVVAGAVAVAATGIAVTAVFARPADPMPTLGSFPGN